ncbi:hypothetical protein [Saccharothrix obliqua]|uniref:hypothetical protein n=1 Tax=Saccharothrix obliqua TaxID=2861747 RepID=UPI001C5E9F87|nr:hypothetical protein [Saccharothrix obliqua]MBW4720446.1 hypothetical protein [Saccharothrix obliqua]
MGVDELVWWAVSLLPEDERAAAGAELVAHGVRRPGRDEPAVLPAEFAERRLRAADTVRACDDVLAGPFAVDWPGLAAAHARVPFGRAQRRALVARPDCPDELVPALVTPWDPLVAARVGARGRAVPRSVRLAVTARIGEVRPALVRAVLAHGGPEVATELVTGVPHLGLLVRAVDGFDHNHADVVTAFWSAVAALLRPWCGDDPRAWRAASAAVGEWPGTFAGLLRRVAALPGACPDPRVLVHAPVFAEVVAAASDDEVAEMAARHLSRLRVRGEVLRQFVERLAVEGVEPRPVFARLVRAAHPSTAARMWAHGQDSDLDRLNELAAERDPELRRFLAARQPRREPGDLVAALRRCAGAVEAEAVLAGVDPPWGELERAHAARPLPEPVVCALVDRPGFPRGLVSGLSVERVTLLAPRSAEVARVALAGDRAEVALVERIRRAGTLGDDELMSTLRPAREVLEYLHTVHRREPDDPWVRRFAADVRRAARSPGFWTAFRRALTTARGPLGPLLSPVNA